MSDSTHTSGETVASRYRLVRCLGRGGQASVWLAQELNSSRSIALKLPTARAQNNAQSLLRLQREAELLRRLDHPNIARCHDYSLEVAQPYIAMEYVPGVSLARELAKRAGSWAHFSREEVRTLFASLLGAIEYAHELGVVHRDLKPDNIMLATSSSGPEVKVLDLGVARLLEQDDHAQTTQGRLIGSVMYMSPEQALGERADERSDIFALGVILFEVMTLRRAWAQTEDGDPLPAYLDRIRLDRRNAPTEVFARIRGAERPRPGRWRVDVPSGLDEVVERALAVQRAHRIASAREFAEALADVLGVDEEPTRLTVLAEPSSSSVDSLEALDPALERAVLDLRADELARARLVASPSAPGATLTASGAAWSPDQSEVDAPSFATPVTPPARGVGRALTVALVTSVVLGLGTLAGLSLSRDGGPVETQIIKPAASANQPVVVRSPRVEMAPEEARTSELGDSAPTPKLEEPRVMGASERPRGATKPAEIRAAREAPAPKRDRELVALSEKIERLRQNPSDLGLFSATGRAVIELAERRVQTSSRRARIKRLATSSMRVADLAQLERAFSELRDATE